MRGQCDERPRSTRTTSRPRKLSKPSRQTSPAVLQTLKQCPRAGLPSCTALAGTRRPRSRRRPAHASFSSSPRTQRNQTSPTSPLKGSRRRMPSTSTSSPSSSPPSGMDHRRPPRRNLCAVGPTASSRAARPCRHPPPRVSPLLAATTDRMGTPRPPTTPARRRSTPRSGPTTTARASTSPWTVPSPPSCSTPRSHPSRRRCPPGMGPRSRSTSSRSWQRSTCS